MTDALAPRPVTADELELVKQTVAQGATAAELKLYLYDCQRQGVHPLDRLLHFTKRGGKYTPVTSIDFMRIRAAESGEYAGSDDAVFVKSAPGLPPPEATVCVWRLVQGTRCPFTATARWSEYKPSDGDFMWKKMPHTMLAKCAEALALRKGFPRQLAGLYAREEMDMDQSESKAPTSTIQAPAAPARDRETRAAGTVENPGSPTGTPADNFTYSILSPAPLADDAASGEGRTPAGSVGEIPAPDLTYTIEAPDANPQDAAAIEAGAVFLVQVRKHAKGKILATVITHQGEAIAVVKDGVLKRCEQACQDGEPVYLDVLPGRNGKGLFLNDLRRARVQPGDTPKDHGPITDDSQTPF